MIYKIFISYLIGIIFAVNFDSDWFAQLFIFLFFAFSHLPFYFHKRHIKTIKDIYKIYVLLILYSVFLVSNFNTEQQLDLIKYKDLPRNSLKISGIVEDVKPKNSQQIVTIQVENILNTTTGLVIKKFPASVKTIVSPYVSVSKYDSVNLTGEMKLDNFQTYYNKKPLFFNYEFENLFYNTNYSVSQPESFEVVVSDKSRLQKLNLFFLGLSETLKSQVQNFMSEPYAQVAEGISLGNQENLIIEIKDIFKKSGLIHILVLSGANITFVISIIWYFLRKQKNRFKVYLAVIFSWVFIFITGLTAPSVRAGTMSTSNILAEYFGKNISSFESLILSLFILTIINPLTLIFSPSLHLSFLACFGLFILAPEIEKYLIRKTKIFNKYILLNFLFSSFLGIFLTTTPYVLALTGSTSLFGTILTFFVEPLILISTILSFLIIISSFLNFYLASFFGIINTIVVKIILVIATFGADFLPQISLGINKYELIFYYILIFIFMKNVIIVKNESK